MNRPAPALARITLHGTQITESDTALARARELFDRTHAVRIPGLLDPDLLNFVRQDAERAGFHTRVHEALASRPTDLELNPCIGESLLVLALNDARFLAFARGVTGREDIRSFAGTIHRRLPGAGHEGAWHDDMADGRIAVLSVNLGAEPYGGGRLQIREEPGGAIVFDAQNIVAGDAILFKLSSSLKHRVTPPEGAPRTVFAGWFRTEPAKQLFRLISGRAESSRRPRRSETHTATEAGPG